MILRGILDNSLNGQLCIRGFAPIKELAKISKADYSYQRNPIERSDIADFLEKQTYLFFPEIILSYKIKHSFSVSGQLPLVKIQEGKTYTSKVDNTVLSVKKVERKSNDITNKTDIKIIDLNIPDILFINGNKLFHRIDGNHRLKAAEDSNDPKVIGMVAPFCIILGVEYYENESLQNNNDTNEFDKSVKVFFHNINTKTIPLTSEENLKVLIDDKVCFTDRDLEEIFCGEYPIKTRELINKGNPEVIFRNLPHLKNNHRTIYNKIFSLLLDKGYEESNIVERVFDALKEIEVLYRDDIFKNNSNKGLLYSFLYYNVTDKTKYNFFKDWVVTNKLFEISEAKAETIINIFDKVVDQNITIFVAMPYYSKDEVTSYNQAYQRVVDKLKTKNTTLKIELYQIMQHEGETYNINNKMIEQIKECTIFVADISNGNINVAFELGYARSIEKPTIMIKRQNDTNRTPFDYEQDMCHLYNHLALNTLEDVVFNNIKAILVSKGFVFSE